MGTTDGHYRNIAESVILMPTLNAAGIHGLRSQSPRVGSPLYTLQDKPAMRRPDDLHVGRFEAFSPLFGGQTSAPDSGGSSLSSSLQAITINTISPIHYSYSYELSAIRRCQLDDQVTWFKCLFGWLCSATLRFDSNHLRLWISACKLNSCLIF